MQSTKPIKVLYFTWVPVGRPDNGGSIVCRYHLERLAACEGVELHVATFDGPENEISARAFIATLGAAHHPIRSRTVRVPTERELKWRPSLRWPFLLEPEAFSAVNIEWQFSRMVEHLQPDVVIIDYLLSALFVRSVFALPVRIITISLNREAEFHAEMRRAGRLGARVSKSIVALWRLASFERWVIRNSDALVVLSEGDLPPTLRRPARTAVIGPVLDRSRDRWRYSGSRALLYVGNIDHYPNFLAVKWIAEEFAPALAKLRPDLRVKIVGATVEQVPPAWIRENVEYLGRCDDATLTQLFCSCDAFIAPIENNFGAKMKVMQCLAYGTPLFATRGALSGVPFKEIVPQFSLSDPDRAASDAADLLDSEDRVSRLSAELELEHARSLASRDEAWQRLIADVASRPVRSRWLRRLLSPLFRGGHSEWFDTSQPWPSGVEIGVEEPLGVTASGVYGLEYAKEKPLRWTQARADFAVELNQATLPRMLSVNLWGVAPPAGTDFNISINGKPSYQGKVTNTRIKCDIPLPDLSGTRELRIRFESSVFQPEGDTRQIGVAIRSMKLSR